MGQEAKKRAEVRHVRKLFGGMKSAEQIHREVALAGKRCTACGGPAAVRCRFLAPVDDMVAHEPQFMMSLAAEHDGQVPVVESRYGKLVRISDAYACDGCRPMLEREAAKAPSWVIVDLDVGPGPDKTVVQVPGDA